MNIFKELKPGIYKIQDLYNMLNNGDVEVKQWYFDNVARKAFDTNMCEKEVFLQELSKKLPNSTYNFKKSCNCSKLIVREG